MIYPLLWITILWSRVRRFINIISSYQSQVSSINESPTNDPKVLSSVRHSRCVSYILLDALDRHGVDENCEIAKDGYAMMTSSIETLLAICEGDSLVHKVQWRGVLMFSLICTWKNGWVNNRKAGDLRRHPSLSLWHHCNALSRYFVVTGTHGNGVVPSAERAQNKNAIRISTNKQCIFNIDTPSYDLIDH